MMKIKILFLAANPDATEALALGRELRAVRDQVRASELRDVFELIPCFAVRAGDLQQTLLQVRPDIVHVGAHGTRAGEIVLERDGGGPKLVGKDTLGRLLSVLKDDIRLVVLNACHSRQQAEEISRYVDCAIGMECALGDEAAIAFATGLYRAIGYGRSLRDAFALGCSAIELESSPEHGTPKMFLKAGVDAGDVVLARRGTSSGTGATPTPREGASSFAGRAVSTAGKLVLLLFGAAAALHCYGPGAARPSVAPGPPAISLAESAPIPATSAAASAEGLRLAASAPAPHPAGTPAASTADAPSEADTAATTTRSVVGNVRMGDDAKMGGGNVTGCGATDLRTGDITCGARCEIEFGNIDPK